MSAPPVVRIPLPVVPPDPPRPTFPLVATIAPLAVAGVLFAVTGSPYVLLMAVLGPVIALASLLDSRRQRARSRREGEERRSLALADVRSRVHDAQQSELRRLRTLASADPGWTPSPDGALEIAVARGEVASGIVLGDGQAHAVEWEALRREAARLEHAPVIREVADGVVLDGDGVAAAAAARLLALRIAARLSPATTVLSAPPTESWARSLPHEVRDGPERRYEFAAEERSVAIEWGETAAPLAVHVALASADALTAAAARQEAERFALAAATRGLRPAARALPERVELAALLRDGPPGPGLSAPLGRDEAGVLTIDLVADGPHALVAGTTGSGKSELLVAWLLGMAWGRSPDEVAFVLVDFKGGAAFAPLAALPHVLGTVSDLDDRIARRALDSLRAEVLRRERLLAAAGVRAIDELPRGALARLVIVVDEFAAVVADRPELHALFADLAARGRSLGLHLVLCTQRPAGVVRDAVLANVAVRIALRISDRSDSLSLIGTDAAARLPVAPKGRAMLLDGAGPQRLMQVAIAGPGDIARVAAATAPSAAFRPWTDPLPSVIPHESLDGTGPGVPFGLLDLPAEQRQPVAALLPAHGHLLVLGAPGSGATTALEAIAAGARGSARWLPSDPVQLWAALTDPTADLAAAGRVLLLDDLDLVLARTHPDHAVELADLVGRMLRETLPRGARVVASARRLGGPLHGLAPLFGSRLLLRVGSREEHLLAGGDPSSYDPRSTPGAGTWDGAVVQVARPAPRPRVAVPVEAPARVPRAGELAIVSTRPRVVAERLSSAGRSVRRLGEPAATVVAGHAVLLGDPDAWQADWSELARARRDLPMVLHECGVAEHRALTRTREMPPLLGPGEVWLVDQARTRRAVWDDGGAAPEG